MNTQCTFDFVNDKDVELRFDGGTISTDAGLSVLINWMPQIDFIAPYDQVLEQSDDRDPNRTHHTRTPLLRQCVLQIVAGYEDANDSVRCETHHFSGRERSAGRPR